MKYNKNVLKAFALCFGFFSFTACRERSTIKPDLVPAVDNINTFGMSLDAFDATLENGYYDSLISDNAEPVTIGGIAADPFFGKSLAGLYFQVLPPTTAYPFPAELATIDSVVLAIPYAGFTYGDTTGEGSLALNVYRVNAPEFGTADYDKSYYVYDQLAYDPSPITGSINSLRATIYDSVTYPSGRVVANTMRIKLPTNFIDQFRNADSSVYDSRESFVNFFNGFYIAPDTTAGTSMLRRLSFFSLGLNSSDTAYASHARMEVFFTNTENEKGVIFFQHKANDFDSTGGRFFTAIRRNYTGFPGSAHTSGNHDSVLIQSTPGLYTEITLRNLQNIPASVINKAQFTITALAAGEDSVFRHPESIIPLTFNDDGTLRVIADNIFTTGADRAFINGKPKYVMINGQTYIQYQVNIPRELQNAVLAGKDSLKIRFTSALNYPGAFRLLGGGLNGNAETKLKFDVIYTKQ